MIIRFLNNRCGAFHRHHAKERWSKEESGIGSSIMIICCNRRIGHRIVHNDHLLQQWKRGSGRRHGCSSRFPPVRIQGRGKHAQSLVVLTGVEPGGRGRTLPESRPHAATEMNFGLREKYAEIYFGIWQFLRRSNALLEAGVSRNTADRNNGQCM